MAVETLQSASAAAAPSGAASTAVPASASPAPAAPALSFEDLVAAELGEDAAAPGTGTEAPKRSRGKGTKPAATSKPAAAGTKTTDKSTTGPEALGGGEPDYADDDDLPADPEDGEEEQDDGAAADEGTEEEEESTDDETADSEGEEPAEDLSHEALPPEHFKKLPAWAQKRLGKQAETVRDLKAQLAGETLSITPTAASPLAKVATLEELHQQTDLAKQIRKWCRENPDGGMVGQLEVTAEEAAAKLAYAESVLEAAPDWQLRLTRRAEAKPWEQARKVCPELFDVGTEEHAFAQEALKLCPEIQTRLPNWEMFLAAAVRSIKQVKEESEGKARYVRMEVKDGKLTAPRKAEGLPKPGTKPAPLAGGRSGTARPPVTPGGSPPPLRSQRNGKPDTAALTERFQKSRDPEDFAALVAAELS